MPKNMTDVFDAFENATTNLIDGLREIVDNINDAPAGAGEDAFIEEAPCQEAPAYGGNRIDDDTMVTLRSGDLRQVVDAYRTLSRLARTGKVPTQEERFKLHQHIKKVKHLIRKPIR